MRHTLYRPRVATIGKALLFPSSVEALGPIAGEVRALAAAFPPYPSDFSGVA